MRTPVGRGGKASRVIDIRSRLPRVEYPGDVVRPTTRSDCVGGERPCPWVTCRHHLAFDLQRKNLVTITYPDPNGDADAIDFDAMPDTCALDAADRGGLTLEETGRRLNLTRERVRQVEGIAERKLRRAHPELAAQLIGKEDDRW